MYEPTINAREDRTRQIQADQQKLAAGAFEIGDKGNARAAGIIGAGNAQANAFNSLLQGGAILGGAAMSDRRLKRDITQLYADEIGGVYEFRYIDHDQKYIGRMADEIQKSRPDAVFVGDDGFMRVTAEFAPRAI